MKKNTSNLCKLPDCYPISLGIYNFKSNENFEDSKVNNYNYDNKKIYKINDIVIFNHVAYKMIDSLGVAGYNPTNTVNWEKLIWDKKKKYSVNDIFTIINYSGNKTYKVILGPIGVNSWYLIDSSKGPTYVWSENVPAANPVSSIWPIDQDTAPVLKYNDFEMLSPEYYKKLENLESPYYKNLDNFTNSSTKKNKVYKIDGTYS